MPSKSKPPPPGRCCHGSTGRHRRWIPAASGGQVAAIVHQSIDSNGASLLNICVALVLLGSDVGTGQQLDTMGINDYFARIAELCFVYSLSLYPNRRAKPEMDFPKSIL
jgi:hypothetical protein